MYILKRLKIVIGFRVNITQPHPNFERKNIKKIKGERVKDRKGVGEGEHEHRE